MVAPIRVLYLRDTTFVCGPGKTILNTFRTADRSKVSIALGIPGWTSAPNALITAAQSIGLPIVPLSDSGRLGVMAARQLARVIEDGEFDLVQSHDFRTRRLATLACTLASVPHVTSVHGWIVNSHRQRLADHRSAVDQARPSDHRGIESSGQRSRRVRRSAGSHHLVSQRRAARRLSAGNAGRSGTA